MQHTLSLVYPLQHTVLMSFGEGFLGNLGHGDFKPSPEPRVVAELANQNIVQIAAGWYEETTTPTRHQAALLCVPPNRGHSMALDDEGTMFLFGRTHDFGNTLRYAACIHSNTGLRATSTSTTHRQAHYDAQHDASLRGAHELDWTRAEPGGT